MSDTSPERPFDAAPAGRLVPAGASTPAARDPYAPLGGYNPVALGEPGADMRATLFEYLRIVMKRRWLIASIALSVLALGTVRTLMQTPLYTSAVRLQIDRTVIKPFDAGNVTPMESGDTEFLRTQYELLQSRAMAERVASALSLGEDADFFRPRSFSILGAVTGLFKSSPPVPPSAEVSERSARLGAAAGVLIANRAVRPVPGSRLVDITYSDPDPGRAQRIASAFADAFIASNLDKRFEANAYAKTFLEDQIKQLKLRLEDSEKVLLDFAQKEQIVAVTEKSSIAESNLAAANAALGNLISERIKNEQLWKQVEQTNAINLPQLLTNSVIEGLRAKRNELTTEYKEKLETFKPSYPAMVQIDNKIKEIDRQLAAEVRTIKSSFKAAYESSLNQENETKARIETLRAEALDLQKRSIQYNILKREVDTNRELYNGLLQRFKEVDVAGGVGANNVFIIDKAQRAGSPSSPQLSRALMLSLLLGLGLGFAVAFLLERLDDTVHNAEEVERLAGVATLGIIPRVGQDLDFEAELRDPRSALSESYRSLCTALQFSTDSGLPKSLVITSAGPGEGKSSTAMAISRHFATMGLKVLLVDADMRNPSMHKKLGVSNSTGLSNYLTGGCSPPEAFQTTGVPNLAFMPSGPLPPNAADLLGGARLMSLLAIGAEVFDFIVIDGPPVMGLADAPLLSNAAAATAFVVGSGQARTGPVRAALKRLQFGRGALIGSVLTKYDARASGYGYGYGYGYGAGYGYGYGYSYGQGHDEPQTEPVQRLPSANRRAA